MSRSLFVKLNEDGTISHASYTKALDLIVPDDHFAEYNQDYWVFNEVSGQLELIPDAASIKAAAEAQALADQEVAELASKKAEILQVWADAFRAAFYTNITVSFPVTQHEIQFRDDDDRMNLTNKVQGAMVYVIGGSPTESMTFTDADNVVVTMEAQEMMQAGMSILDAKDAIFYQYKAVKDSIKGAADMAELDALDLSVIGWPLEAG